MIINGDGIAVRTTMDTTTTNAYSAVLSRLSDAARSAIRDEKKLKTKQSNPFCFSIWFGGPKFANHAKEQSFGCCLRFGENLLFELSDRDLDPVNDISFIRMRSMKNEILLAPGKV